MVVAGTIQPLIVDLKDQNQILQGSDYYREIPLTLNGSPLDLSQWVGSGKGARCQLRASAEATAVVATPTITIKSPPTAGVIAISMTSAQTTAITLAEGAYDVELFDGNFTPEKVDRPVQGGWGMSKEVTRI